MISLVGGGFAHYAELVMLGSVGVFALVAAALWTRTSPSLTLTRTVRQRRVTAEAGGSVPVEVIVTNRGPQATPSLRLIQRTNLGALSAQVAPLPPGGSTEVVLNVDATRRGVVKLGAVRVERFDPFGLMEIGQRFDFDDSLFILPKTEPVKPKSTTSHRDLDGPTSDTAPQGGIAFHALREYAAGDDLRLVHWRSLAKTGKLFVRHHVDASRPQTQVLLDDRADQYRSGVDEQENFEQAVQVAGSLVAGSLLHSFPIGCAVLSDRRPHSSVAQGIAAMDVLAAAELVPDSEVGFEEASSRVTATEPGGMLVYVTGACSRAQIGTIVRKAHRFGSVTVVRCLGDPPGWPDPIVVPKARVLDVSNRAEFVIRWRAGNR